jgi:cytochrome c-type biogenesis protein CcmH
MSAEDRDAMIASMVDGLAARLADNPDDGPGWQRLARAYDVLGRTDAAQDAFVSAADVLVADADAQLAALQAIVAGNAEDRLATAAERLLARLVDQAPARPETLYLRGHFAATSGDGEAAREFWQQLLDRLPEDAPIASQLRAAIDAL